MPINKDLRSWRRTDEEQREDDDQLIDSVSEDVLGHGAGDERLVAAVGLPLEQRLGGRFRCQGQGCKRVHDQVHPQHLHGLQGGVLEEGVGETVKFSSLSTVLNSVALDEPGIQADFI